MGDFESSGSFSDEARKCPNDPQHEDRFPASGNPGRRWANRLSLADD